MRFVGRPLFEDLEVFGVYWEVAYTDLSSSVVKFPEAMDN